MDDAESGARQGDPNGTVYIADKMTSGRGTKGRTWVAENNGNLYMSFVIYNQLPQDENPSVNRCREFDFEVAGTLASLVTLEEMGIKGANIKWLNDLCIRGHKILGALTEYKGKIIVESQELHLYVLGIGINVNCDMRRDPDMHHISTSVICELGHKVPREIMFAKICNHLEPLLKMDRQELMKLYKDHEAIPYGGAVKAYRYMHDDREEVYTFGKVKDDWSVELISRERHESVCFHCTEITLRPLKEKLVYVLDGPDIQPWSSKCLLKTCNGLVDSQKYEVKSLLTENVSLDKLSSCALVVIGQVIFTSKTKPKYVGMINDYVRNGGSCLAIGNASLLFEQKYCIQDLIPDQDQEQIPSIIKSVVGTFPSTKQHINLCLFHENGQLVHGLYNTSNVFAYRYSNTKCDVEGNDTALRSADVVVFEEGSGKICLSKPNIEICYADLDEYFPGLKQNKAALQKTVQHRDNLFLDVLEKLLA